MRATPEFDFQLGEAAEIVLIAGAEPERVMRDAYREAQQLVQRVGQYRIGNKFCDTSNSDYCCSDMPRNVNTKMDVVPLRLTVPV